MLPGRITGRRLVAALTATSALLLGGIGAVTPSAAVDSIRANEWFLDAMHAPQMWKISTGKGITVAVIDSGVDANHPDLMGKVLVGRNFSDLPGGATTDVDGHGTSMADLIAGTGRGLDGKGAYGLAPGARILPLRVGTTATNEVEHGGEFRGQLARAIRFAANSQAQVINVSQVTSQTDKRMDDAVSYAIGKGKLVVAGAGNSGDTGNPLLYPAAVPGVLAASAVGENGKATAESEHGPQIGLAAPGDNIYDACASASGYCKSHGTSDAAALVSASAALVWAEHRDWTANQVMRVLLNTAGKPQDGSVRNDYLGYGIVRPRVALTRPGDPGPADVNPLIAAARSASPSASGTGAPSSAAPSVPASHGQPPASAPAGRPSGSAGLWIAIGAGVLVLVAAGGAILLVRRTRGGTRPPSGPGGPGGPGRTPGGGAPPAGVPGVGRAKASDPGFGPPHASYGPPGGTAPQHPQPPARWRSSEPPDEGW